MIRRSLVLFASLAALAGAKEVQGQDREIQGTVSAIETDAPLPNANVVIVGTTIGTLTGPNGTFTLSVPAGEVSLRISLIGYTTEELTVPAGQNSVNVGLGQDVLNIEGVVVTGQATTVARRNLANAVSTVTAQQLNTVPAQTVDKALQGKVAGANIQTNSGAPGGGVQVDLRGVSSINAQSEPLWVIDGVVISNVAIASGANAVTRASSGSNASNQDGPVNRIADINPQDIERIEVLKGASASAIYGSQASNGVIIVTTRRGRAGAPRINVTQRFGTYRLSNKIGSRTFGTLDEALGAYASFSGAAAADTARIAAAFGDGTAFDHEEALAGRTDLSTETAFSMSGGTENTAYFVSGLVQDDAGIIDNTGYEKQSLRVNLDQRLGTRISLGVNANVLHTLARRGLSNNDNTGTSYYVALAGTPSFVALGQRADGSFPDNPLANSNPLETTALMQNDEDVWRFIAGGSATVDLLGESFTDQSLQLLFTGGADYFTQENELFFPPELQFESDDGEPGTSVLGASNNINLNGNANLIHAFTPGSGAFTATTSAGVQYVDQDLNVIRNVGRNLIAGQPNIDAATNLVGFENRQRVRTLGLYMQEEVLLLNERLLLTGSVRADRSSANGDADEYFLYPKLAGSYRFPDLARGVDELKLRLAYGESGNQPLFGQKFTPLSGTNNIEGLPALVVGGVAGDADITPERTREIEGGFDAVLFGGSAELNFTLYRQNISDLLLQRTVAPSTGFVTQIFNGGKMQNRGVEISLAATPARSRQFSWVTQATFASNETEITELPVPSFRTGGFGTVLGAFQIEEGASATQIVGFNGRDANGAPIVDVLGDANPDFRMGFSNTFTYGPLSLYGLLDWQHGSEIINLTKLLYDLGQVSPDYALPEGVAAPRPVPECHPDCSGLERILGFGTYTQQYIEDGSFLKLRELTLAYDLPAGLFGPVAGGITNASIALSGRNLLTWDDYSGLDPEVSNFGSQQIARNIDVAPFPPSRSFWLSINLGF
ncbi:MAG: SusC/RagA family TonB-linked outer membrane protein [Longimicrobiaceae bacterium]